MCLRIIKNNKYMGKWDCFKECSCWCLFTIAAIMMLVVISLLISDISMISQRRDLLEQIVDTPLPRLKCLEICKSWYSVQLGHQCCDRYNMDLCVSKELCKAEYIQQSSFKMQTLYDNKNNELFVIAMCGLVLLLVAWRARKKQKKGRIMDNSDMGEIIKKVIETPEKQRGHKASRNFCNFGLGQTIKKVRSQSTLQSERNVFGVQLMENKKISYPLLLQTLKHHYSEP